MVDVLFDYKPEVWFRPAGWVKPPSRLEAENDALRQLRTIGQKSLAMKGFPAPLRKQVQLVIKEINERLNEK